MSVFDLDVVSFYLSDRFEFLYYIRQRVDHAVHFIADSEMTLLGFHLKRKLFPQDNADGMLIDASYSQLADANLLVARGNWQASEADDRLFHEWKNDAFDQLLADVKTVANTQLRPGVATEDVVFHLYDFAGEAADYLIKTAENQKLATLRDGQRHDVRVPIPAHKKGATFVSFPRPQHSIDRELFTRDLRAIALAHKYRSQADEWLILASFAGSETRFDVMGYVKEPWQPDQEMDQLVNAHLDSGRVVNSEGKKLGRNERCPCGRGKKFKRCHGR